MTFRVKPKLNSKKCYLQIALNSTLEEAHKIINELPISDRIIIEAGTPLIKKYGEYGISQIKSWYEQRIFFGSINDSLTSKTKTKETNFSKIAKYIISQINSQATRGEQEEETAFNIFQGFFNNKKINEPILPANLVEQNSITPYIVADLKTMDRAETEVQMAANAGASAAVALGTAPTETLNSFIEHCEKNKIDAMIDMMNVEFPLSVLRSLKKVPPIVILHRGADEEKFNKEKMIPLHEIRRIKGNYDIMIAIAGGDTLREVQSSVFNDADIVVIWKSVFQKNEETINMVNGFLKQIK
ncbi:MAG: orotidine 5'-phosphate decarboxylase / HUMPS family protein [Patescibacteria group bacterium]